MSRNSSAIRGRNRRCTARCAQRPDVIYLLTDGDFNDNTYNFLMNVIELPRPNQYDRLSNGSTSRATCLRRSPASSAVSSRK